MTLAQQLGLRAGDDPAKVDYYLSLRAPRAQRLSGTHESARAACNRFLMQMAMIGQRRIA